MKACVRYLGRSFFILIRRFFMYFSCFWITQELFLYSNLLAQFDIITHEPKEDVLAERHYTNVRS